MALGSLSGISVTAVSRPEDIVTIGQQSALVFGSTKEISGWASMLIVDSGIIAESLIGSTVKLEVKLTVTSIQESIDPGSRANTLFLNLVGNSSDFVVRSFKEDPNDPLLRGIEEVLSEEVKASHRFTGFMENPKEL